MIRLIARTTDQLSGPGPGPYPLHYKTFDIDLPELERFLSDPGSYAQAEVIGAEVIAAAIRKGLDE